MMALPALATVEQVQARTGQTYEGADLARVKANLEDASALVRAETGTTWADEDGTVTAPDVVVTVTLQAALRAVRNPEGFVAESEGDYSGNRSAVDGVTIYLTGEEKALLRRYSGGGQVGLWTLPTTRDDLADTTLWAEDSYGLEPFPLYARGDVVGYE